jgi:hypothetical protein
MMSVAGRHVEPDVLDLLRVGENFGADICHISANTSTAVSNSANLSA